MKLWTFLFILIPVTEIIVLLLSGKLIGIGWTVFMLFLTGVIGVLLAKRQGIQTLRRAQAQLNRGEIPGEELYNGICIVIGGLLLLLPGLVSDLIGILLLIPVSRKMLKPIFYLFIKKYMDRSRNTITIIR